MTKEGRLFTHLNELKLGRDSPYADEFKDYKEKPKKNKDEVEDDGRSS